MYHNSPEFVRKTPEWIKCLSSVKLHQSKCSHFMDFQKKVNSRTDWLDSSFTSEEAKVMVLKIRMTEVGVGGLNGNGKKTIKIKKLEWWETEPLYPLCPAAQRLENIFTRQEDAFSWAVFSVLQMLTRDGRRLPFAVSRSGPTKCGAPPALTPFPEQIGKLVEKATEDRGREHLCLHVFLLFSSFEAFCMLTKTLKHVLNKLVV